jgi:adenylate kinase family enzyme
MDKKQYNKISETLFSKLKNTNIYHSPFIITFSGVPGCGKSSLAKLLEQKYRAVRINNDFIREIIRKRKLTNSEEDVEQLLQDYNYHLIENYPFKNKLIILDKSMDRRYNQFIGLFKSENLEYFVIRLDTPNIEMALKMLGKREEITKQVKNSMKRWFREYHRCCDNLKADITFDVNNIDLNKLFNKLDERLLDKSKKNEEMKEGLVIL